MRLPFQRKTSPPQPATARNRFDPTRSCSKTMDAWGDVVYRVALAQTGSPSDADDVFRTCSCACWNTTPRSKATST